MKTPREILLQRHQAAQTKLDALRREVIANLAPKGKPDIPLVTSAFKLALRQWFWPSPWAWAGTGAAWLLIFVFEFSGASSADRNAAIPAQTPPVSIIRMASAERRVLMNSLLDSAAAEPAIPPRPPVSPRPHSERKPQWYCA